MNNKVNLDEEKERFDHRFNLAYFAIWAIVSILFLIYSGRFGVLAWFLGLMLLMAIAPKAREVISSIRYFLGVRRQ